MVSACWKRINLNRVLDLLAESVLTWAGLLAGSVLTCILLVGSVLTWTPAGAQFHAHPYPQTNKFEKLSLLDSWANESHNACAPNLGILGRLGLLRAPF